METNVKTTEFRRHAHEIMKAANANEPITYKVDREGNTVRIPTETRRVLDSEIIEALWNKRGVTIEEMLEAVGREVFTYMIRVGYLRKSATFLDTYWITKKAADRYNLHGCKIRGIFEIVYPE